MLHWLIVPHAARRRWAPLTARAGRCGVRPCSLCCFVGHACPAVGFIAPVVEPSSCCSGGACMRSSALLAAQPSQQPVAVLLHKCNVQSPDGLHSPFCSFASLLHSRRPWLKPNHHVPYPDRCRALHASHSTLPHVPAGWRQWACVPPCMCCQATMPGENTRGTRPSKQLVVPHLNDRAHVSRPHGNWPALVGPYY